MSRTAAQQLVHFLSDMYAVEQQALAQLVSAPNLAGDPLLAEAFRQHHVETEQQAILVQERLAANGGSSSAIKDVVMKLGGKGFLLFAATQPETPGKLLAHAYAYEAMEWAGYEMLAGLAERAGDAETVAVARLIRNQEWDMMKRLEGGFDSAETVVHGGSTENKIGEHLITHLTEAHALESQALQLLSKSESIAGNALLAQIYRQNLDGAHRRIARIKARLEELGHDASGLKDGVMALVGINWSFFFRMQSDTPVKLAAFVFAVEHLKIAGYELLQRTARRAHDPETEGLCSDMIADERASAERLMHGFDSAVEATLKAVRG